MELNDDFLEYLIKTAQFNSIHEARWKYDNVENRLRYDYPLTKDSVVFDIGTFMGDFAEGIRSRYGCKIFCYEPMPTYFTIIQNRFHDENIRVRKFAMSDNKSDSKIFFHEDGSSLYVFGTVVSAVECTTLDREMDMFGIDHINLIKINIEGGEYPLLNYMIKKRLHEKCDDIQVQFHTFIDGYQQKYDYIASELSKTHEPTYRYPFVWENWRRK